MEYNTDRNHLIIPEYGRNIQKMIDYAITIEDRELRNNVAKSIVEVMAQLNPQMKDLTDFKHKLWDLLFIISDFRLDVDSPYPVPSPQTLAIKPERIKYPSNHVRFKHYGKNIELMIDDIKKMEEGEDKDELIAAIANFMKMAYLNHNRDTVSDELIVDHLDELSKGELKLKENFRLNNTSDLLSKPKKPLVERRPSKPQIPGRNKGNIKKR